MLKKARNSNLEILRIISMLMIIVSHYSVHNKIDFSAMPFSFNKYLLQICLLGNIGVILFIMITGYFSVESKKGIKISKIFKIYLQVVFYAVTIFSIFVLLGKVDFSLKQMIKNLFPITYKRYWFITAYVVLYLLTPFLNEYINSINRKKLLNFILALFTLIAILSFFTTSNYFLSEITQFILFYSMGAYLKKYPSNIFTKKKVRVILIITTIILLLASVLLINIAAFKISELVRRGNYFFSRISPLVILLSLGLFTTFINKKEYSSKFLNTVSATTFGIYLIHDNEYIRSVLWSQILKVPEIAKTNYLLLHMLISVIGVFVVCSIIEFIRINTIERVTDKIFLNRIDKWQDKFMQFKDKIMDKFI